MHAQNLVVLAANVAYWTDRVRDWLRHRRWDVALLSEVHFHPKNLKQNVQALLDEKYIPTVQLLRYQRIALAIPTEGLWLYAANICRALPWRRTSPSPDTVA